MEVLLSREISQKSVSAVLGFAAATGNAEVLQALLEAHANVNDCLATGLSKKLVPFWSKKSDHCPVPVQLMTYFETMNQFLT